MDATTIFLDCPAYLEEGTLRCGLPAEVRCRYAIRSTGGPLEAAMIRCPRRALVQRAGRIKEAPMIDRSPLPEPRLASCWRVRLQRRASARGGRRPEETVRRCPPGIRAG
jgi:hypothetical protein